MDALTGCPSLADADLERRIEDARVQMMAAKTPACVRSWADEMTRLINSRSPERIQQMESELGLR